MRDSSREKGVVVRIVGYVREAPVLGESETAYAQKEVIRRWSAESGHLLISVCQDLRVSGTRANRNGYRALLDIVRSGNVEAVAVADLDALSPDKVLQEIMIEDLRRGGVVVVSTDAEQMERLEDPTRDRVRMIVGDIVTRVRTYVAEYPRSSPNEQRIVDLRDDRADVTVELIRAIDDEPNGDQPDERAAHTARPTA